MVYLCFVLVLLATGTAGAGPLDAPGYAKAFTCSACHGFAGNSKADTVPILAGMPPAYLKKALADYASGKRLSTEMEPYSKMAIHLGVDDVAAYFAAQKREPWPGRRGATLAVHSTLGYAGGFVGPLALGVTLDLLGGASVLGWGLAFGHVTLVLIAGAIAFVALRPAELAGDRAAVTTPPATSRRHR